MYPGHNFNHWGWEVLLASFFPKSLRKKQVDAVLLEGLVAQPSCPCMCRCLGLHTELVHMECHVRHCLLVSFPDVSVLRTSQHASNCVKLDALSRPVDCQPQKPFFVSHIVCSKLLISSPKMVQPQPDQPDRVWHLCMSDKIVLIFHEQSCTNVKHPALMQPTFTPCLILKLCVWSVYSGTLLIQTPLGP